MRQITWSSSHVELLLKCILKCGAYAPPHGKSDQVWEEVNDMFFNSPLGSPLKAECYNAGGFRKFKDKYKELQLGLVKDSNYQAFRERFSEITYQDAEPILEYESTTLPENQKLYAYMVSIELATELKKPGKNAHKHSDDRHSSDISSTQHDTQTNKSNESSINGKFKRQSRVHNLDTSIYKKARSDEDERVIEKKMNHWYISCGGNAAIRDILRLIWNENEDGKIKLEDSIYDTIHRIGFDILLAIYCTHGKPFDMEIFKRDCEKLDISLVLAIMLYKMFEKLREIIHEEEDRGNVIDSDIS